MNVDITNHLVPWTIVKQMLKDAQREAYDEGWQDAYYDVWCTENSVTNERPDPYEEDND